MYIRIPTGFKTLSIEAQRTGIIEYSCTKCGKVHLQKINAATLCAEISYLLLTFNELCEIIKQLTVTYNLLHRSRG